MFLTTLFPEIPTLWLYLIVFGFGIIIGSFLNVYIYRFHTGKSLSGHSHCLSCATPLKWFELFPLLSYLCLRARCRTCGCKIPSRYFLVELMTGVLFIGATSISVSLFEMFLFWFVVSVFVVIAVYDLYHFIIPDVLTITLLLSVFVLFAYRYCLKDLSTDSILWSFFAAFCGSLFFLFLWVISKGKWLGFGDVKLAFPLGLLVGPQYVFSFVVLSFWVGAIISLILLTVAKINRGKSPLHLSDEALTMKSAVPFAPFLIASCLIILFLHLNVLELFSFS